jgi:hypothetical protein
MPPITHGSRLDRLRNLRDRVDAEIRSIEQARTRLLNRHVSDGRTSRPQPDMVRAWAISQGLDVAATGRIPKRVMDAYLAASGEPS